MFMQITFSSNMEMGSYGENRDHRARDRRTWCSTGNGKETESDKGQQQHGSQQSADLILRAAAEIVSNGERVRGA